MCSPSLALGAQGFGGGMSAFGSFFQAKSDQSALRSQARILETNARIAEDTARRTAAAGTVEESRIKLKGAQVKSRQIAELGARGIDIAGSNSALAQLTGTDLITDVDAATLRDNALRAALGQRIQADNYRSQAVASRASADSISPGLALGSSLIQSAGQVAKSWYTMDKEGAFDKAGGKLNPVDYSRMSMSVPNNILPGDQPAIEMVGDDPFGFGHLTPKRYRNTSIMGEFYGKGL